MNNRVEAKQDKMLYNLLNSSATPYKDKTSVAESAFTCRDHWTFTQIGKESIYTERMTYIVKRPNCDCR